VVVSFEIVGWLLRGRLMILYFGDFVVIGCWLLVVGRLFSFVVVRQWWLYVIINPPVKNRWGATIVFV
jgi:hypothetical protein